MECQRPSPQAHMPWILNTIAALVTGRTRVLGWRTCVAIIAVVVLPTGIVALRRGIGMTGGTRVLAMADKTLFAIESGLRAVSLQAPHVVM